LELSIIQKINRLLVNSSSNLYGLVNSDTVLSSSRVLDGNLPDNFVTQVENEVDLGDMDLTGVDGDF
jgi:hypothetical protein